MSEEMLNNEIDIVEKTKLKELSRRSNLKGSIQLLTHFGTLALTGTLLYETWGTAFTPIIFLIHGILINYLYAAEHELSHWSVFKSRKLNEAVGAMVGFILLIPAKWDQWFHFAHHRHTHNWDKDAELVSRSPYTFRSYLLALSGLSYWVETIIYAFTVPFGKIPKFAYWLNESQKRKITREAQIHLTLYIAIFAASLYFKSWLAIQVWIAPMFLTKMFHQIQNLSEHTGLTSHQSIIENTRTLKGPWVMRTFLWNMQYHTAHHLYPAVPFHALPELQKQIEKSIGSKLESTGYLDCQINILKSLWSGGERIESK